MMRRTGLPTYVVPGNHDRRENLKRCWATLPGVTTDPEFRAVRDRGHPVRLIFLDTVVPAPGQVRSAPAASVLDEALASARRRRPSWSCTIRPSPAGSPIWTRSA
jgi:3',5'-cyclic AMP phosphodiesterase CpdA